MTSTKCTTWYEVLNIGSLHEENPMNWIPDVHWLSQLVCVTIRSYIVLYLFYEYVIFYQEKSFMFHNIWTTYWTFVCKNQTPK